MTTLGWKMVCPSPRNAFLLPVGNTTPGMTAMPIPERVALKSRIFGYTVMSPMPCSVNV